MTRRIVALLSLALAPLPAQTSDLDRRLSNQIAAALKQSNAPSVSVAVVQDGKLAFAKAFGKARLDPDRDASVETRYAIGSISKQFTAAAVLLLQEQGKLSLDDKVAKYFPGLTRAGEITIRQLLSHTSGYEDYAPQDYLIPEWTRAITPEALLDRWARKPLNFDPGTKWQYSNTNYVLAAEIVEKVSGRPLMAFLDEHIFRPLGMATAVDWYAHPQDANDAAPYTRYAGGPPRPIAREAPGWYSGAAQIAMTPSDLARWDIEFLRRQVLSPRSYDEFTREARLANGDATHYALGLSLGEFNRIPTVSHTGEVSGFLASNTVYPTRNAAVVVLTNQDGVDLMGPVSSRIARTLLLPEETPAARDTAEARAILEALARGRIDRTQFTANANSYFTAAALEDVRKSLKPLGKLQSVTRTSESLRGGMTHRAYSAEFRKKTVSLNVYVMPDGKYEQFLVVE
jgi:CubicO group peptidase (beta-lactamase class C family)